MVFISNQLFINWHWLRRLKEFLFQTVHQNGYEQDPYAKEFGINISEKLASVEARVLPAPWVGLVLQNNFHGDSLFYYDTLYMHICVFQLKYHDAGKEKECLPQVGQWNMVNKVGFQFISNLLLEIRGVCLPCFCP
jgi:hypothetical protein